MMSHFFSAQVGAGYFPDLGAPNLNSDPAITTSVSAPRSLNIPALVNITNGVAQESYTSAGPGAGSTDIGNLVVTTESAKLYSFANTLASCVNTAGLTGTNDTTSNCAQLFAATTYHGSVPATTFQAALYMALYPFNNVSTLFGLSQPKAPVRRPLQRAE